jgi:2-polyprenyl-3-methyl-5-hydroxy-6-metoxy-1,4-benzoquinol methylase
MHQVIQRLELDGNKIENWSQMVSVYQARLKKHGFGYQTLFYPNQQLHHSRLAQIAMIANETITSNDTVLDVGCGYGELVPFLTDCKYHGIDLVDAFINEAQTRYPHIEFYNQNLIDINEKFDWLILAGITGSIPSPFEVLKKAISISKKGVIVDFIDSTKYKKNLNNFKMGELVDFFLDQKTFEINLYRSQFASWVVFKIIKNTNWLL